MGLQSTLLVYLSAILRPGSQCNISNDFCDWKRPCINALHAINACECICNENTCKWPLVFLCFTAFTFDQDVWDGSVAGEFTQQMLVALFP